MWWICQHEPVKNAQKYLFSDFIVENYGICICWEIFIQNNRTWISWTLLQVQNHLQSHHLSRIYHISPYFIMIISWASNKKQFSLQTSLQITKWVNGDGKKGVEKMSNSPLKVMFFKRPSKGTDRVHPDEMQWNDLLKWNEKIETWHTSICFTHQTLDFSEMPNAILGGVSLIPNARDGLGISRGKCP